VIRDSVLASAIKSGYSFVYNAVDSDSDGKMDSYTVRANPIAPGQTGDRYFYVDQTNVVRFNLTGPAGASDDPVPTK